MIKSTASLHHTWQVALGCFIVAGATGALLRFGLLYGFPWGLSFTNVRHAHSHFMYMGWVTPALMALLAAQLARSGAVADWPRWERRFQRVTAATLVLAVLAYLAFLPYGYQVAEIGGRRWPLAVIASSLNIVAWYAFAAVFWRATWGLPRNQALRAWDLALGSLILASAGAWGLGLLRPLGLTDPIWSLALTRLFLDLFASGWFVLALLGLLYAAYPAAARHRAVPWGEGFLIMGLPLIFLLGLPGDLLPGGVRLLAGVAGVLVAAGLLAHLWALWPVLSRSGPATWRVPLIFLGVKAGALLALAFPAGAYWTEALALKISYMHWLLLGFVTLGLIAAAGDVWGRPAISGWPWLTAAVLLLFLSLIPLTRLWPLAWGGRWTLLLAAWAALAPVLVAAAMMLRLPRRKGAPTTLIARWRRSHG